MTATTHAQRSDHGLRDGTTADANDSSAKHHSINRWFSTTGRLNRAGFIGRVLAIYVANFVLAFGLGILLGVQAAMTGTTPSAVQQEAQVLGSILGLIALWPIVCQGVKRLHDLGRPSSHYWLLFVPFYNLYLVGLMLLKRGADGPNAFGPDPLPSRALTASVPDVGGLRPIGL